MNCRADISARRRRGFTLLELLVAISILSIIVVAVAKLFEQSTVAWDRGTRRAESMMIGRAIVDHLATKAALATSNESDTVWSTLEGTNGVDTYTVVEGDMFQDSGSIKMTAPPTVTFDSGTVPPTYADVSVTIQVLDKGEIDTWEFTTRVYLVNRDRYRHEQ